MRTSQVSLQAVVFDFDGTLIDSAPDIAKAINQVLAAIDRPVLTVEAVRGMIGDGAPMLVQRAFAATGTPLTAEGLAAPLAEFMEVYGGLPADPDSIYPGVVDTLDLLAGQGLRLGLCTNKPERITRDLLEGLGLARFFGAVAGGDTLPVRKPDGRPLAWVIERLGAVPEAAVMVGDNANDVATARALGIPVVVVSYGYPRMPIADLGADRVVDRFADLPAALSELVPGPGRPR